MRYTAFAPLGFPLGFALVFCSCVALGPAADRSGESAPALLETVAAEHKGTSQGLTGLPVWVQTYGDSGVEGLEKLPDYNGSYCFVATADFSGLDAALAWIDGLDGQDLVSRQVRERVRAKFSGDSGGASGPSGGSSGDSSGSVSGGYAEALAARVNIAAYAGVRKINDWWIFTRALYSGGRESGQYHALVFYTADRPSIDRQVLAALDEAIAALPASPEEKAAALTARDRMAAEGL